MFKTLDGQAVNIANIYRGYSAFLLVNGPSLRDADLEQLARPGVLTLGVNNGPSVFRPNLWVMGDDVTSFVRSIWLDPKILKFVPNGKQNKELFNNDKMEKMTTRVKNCPSIVTFEMNRAYNKNTFLTDNTLNWGCYGYACVCGYEDPWRKADDNEDDKTERKRLEKQGIKKLRECPKCGQNRWGCRSIFFYGLGLPYRLGIRTLYVVGADFTMAEDHTYAFKQARHGQSVKNNNQYYKEINTRCTEMLPHFRSHGYTVYNCYEQSGLTAYPYMPLADAIEAATRHLPKPKKDKHGLWVCDENTEGLYDRKWREKQAAKRMRKDKEKNGRKFKTLAAFLAHKGVA